MCQEIRDLEHREKIINRVVEKATKKCIKPGCVDPMRLRQNCAFGHPLTKKEKMHIETSQCLCKKILDRTKEVKEMILIEQKQLLALTSN